MQGSDLLRTFETELHRGTEQLQKLLMEIEAIESFQDALPSVQEAYRIVHSIKGASRVVGLTYIEEVAHSLEDRMQSHLNEKRIPSPVETSAYLHAVEGFDIAFRAFLTGGAFDSAPYLEELAAAKAAAPAKAPETKPRELSPPAAVEEQSAPVLKPIVSRQEPVKPVKKDTSKEVSKEESAAPPAPREEYLTVPLRRIDELFRRVEEAFLIESRLAALLGEYDSVTQDNGGSNLKMLWQKKNPQIQKESNRLHFVLMQFHDLVRLFRMVPVGRMRVQLQRTIRDLAHTLEKSVTFHLAGEDQMVDASLLDALQEPLMHIVRNSIDHGIETPAERRKSGKNSEGRIVVEARIVTGFLQLMVADDGAGINLVRVRARALELGLTTYEESEEWGEAQWLEMMFHPGFSTATKVSSISGRGMGMDIVRQRIQELGGYVHVSTIQGVGTTIQIQVPIGLLTPRVLLCKCGPQQVAIPTSDIERVFPFRSSQAETVNGQMMVKLNDAPLPVETLASHLGWESEMVPGGHIIALNRQGTRKGLLVDEILGEIEQVAFPPPWNLRGLPYLSGVIVLGNGTLVPLVEPRDLLKGARDLAPVRIPSTPAESAKKTRTLLVVDDSATILALHRSILKNAGYDVLTADDGAAAWSSLQQQAVDLVLTDIEMPRMNGLELIQKIRSTAALKTVPIIVISQYGSKDDLHRAAELGADRYIVKSAFDPQKLLETVRDLLE